MSRRRNNINLSDTCKSVSGQKLRHCRNKIEVYEFTLKSPMEFDQILITNY